MSFRPFSARLLLVLGVALYAHPAHALRRFPGEIESQLSLPYSPPCSVCHLNGKTGAPTVTTPFAYALRERGLSDSRGSLSLALTRLGDDRTDSDGDGVGDVTELENATDPSSPANASLVDVGDPSYGCSSSPGRHQAPAALALLVGVVAALRLGSKRARRGRS